MTSTASLSLADLRAEVLEYTRYCQDHQESPDATACRVLLRAMRAERDRRVAEIAAWVAA